MNVHEFVVCNRSEFYRMKFAGFFRVHPIKERVHENLNFLWARRDVIADVDLRPTKHAALDGIDVTQNALVNLEDVFEAYVVVPGKAENQDYWENHTKEKLT